MSVVKILGTVAGAAEDVLRVVGAAGEKPVDLAQAAGQVLAIQVQGEGGAERLGAVVGGLSPIGDKGAALGAIYDELPVEWLHVVLNFANGVNKAIKNDGVLDGGEKAQLVLQVAQDSMRAFSAQ